MRIWIVIAASLAVALGAPPAGADDAQREPSGREAEGKQRQETKGAQRSPTDVAAGQIAKDPGTYYDTSVRVQAEVEEVYGSQAFTLDEDMAFAGPDVLVIVPAPLKPAPEGENVTVTGRVHEFVKTNFERDYEWFDANDFGDPDLLVRFESRPVIIAESVRTKGGLELVSKGGAEKGTRHGDAPRDMEHGDAPKDR